MLGKIIGVRWVGVNNGDSEEPEYRPRLVGQEFAIGKDDALYAATPPLEALRIIISHAATFPDEGPERVIMINDMRRAYFYAKIDWDVFIDLPTEDPKYGIGQTETMSLCNSGSCQRMARNIECPSCECRVREGKRPPLCLLAPREAHQDPCARGRLCVVMISGSYELAGKGT